MMGVAAMARVASHSRTPRWRATERLAGMVCPGHFLASRAVVAVDWQAMAALLAAVVAAVVGRLATADPGSPPPLVPAVVAAELTRQDSPVQRE